MNNALRRTTALIPHGMLIAALVLPAAARAQQRVGINTTAPARQLEVHGSSNQYLRHHATNAGSTEAGVELVRGDAASNARDWKLTNLNGNFGVITGTDNFATAGTDVLRITPEHFTAIGDGTPVAPLQVFDGEEASNTSDGYLMIGESGGPNIAMDPDEILARNGVNAATLHLQAHGGNTWFGEGQVILGQDGGRVRIGSSPLNAALNVRDADMQVALRNPADGLNDWYIGASNASWIAGDDLLVFSPTSSSAQAVLRLHRTAENNGLTAPVMIVSPSSNSLLLDGNEIDANTPLYINSNSDEDTYLNPSGGRVGTGTTSPDAALHVKSDGFGLGIARGTTTWNLTPANVTGNLMVYRDANLLAYVSYNGGGAWVALSDARFKQDIMPYGPVLDRIRRLGLYRYKFTYAPDGPDDIGVIAQEAEGLFPEAVNPDGEHYGVAYDVLTVMAVQGLKEQHAQLQDLLRNADECLQRAAGH